MKTTKNKKPAWYFYLGWVTLNILVIVLAWYIAWALMSQITNIVGGRIQVGGQSRITEDFLFMYVLFPIMGLLTGIIQYVLLRLYLPRMVWWIAATLLSWLMPFAIGFFITKLLTPTNNTFLILLGMIVIGTAVALPQWWMLRSRVHHAFWWILAYAFGWYMIGLLNLITTKTFTFLLAVAVVPSITTGAACWLLFNWLPRREIKRNLSSS